MKSDKALGVLARRCMSDVIRDLRLDPSKVYFKGGGQWFNVTSLVKFTVDTREVENITPVIKIFVDRADRDGVHTFIAFDTIGAVRLLRGLVDTL